MAKYPNDDLFESTKMSFGEHLEELRIHLFRALIGLAIGVGVGMFVATYVVDFIQIPLRSAMEKHLVEKALKDIKKNYGDGTVTEEIRDFVTKHHVVFEDIYVESSEVNRLALALKDLPPETSPSDKVAEPDVAKDQKPADTTPSEATPVADATAKKDAVNKSAKPAPTFVGGTPGLPSSKMFKTRIWRELKVTVQSLSADEAFMIWMKAGFVFGVILASPWIFYQIWAFVAAGLYPHEKRYVNIYLPLSLALFLAGAALAFFFVFEPVLAFLFSFNESMNIGIDARISEWLSFVLVLPLGFGISFQLPLVMLFINRLGIVTLDMYLEKWRIAILAVFVISMVLTPADPVSMLLMAVPLSFLYFLGIGLCKWMPKGKNPFAEDVALS